MTSVSLVPTTRVWVSTEVVSDTISIDHTLTATETTSLPVTYIQTHFMTDTTTATATATKTDFMTATVTQVSTSLVPTTYETTMVSTKVIDNVSYASFQHACQF
jgi:hypothetical protein